LEDGGFRTLKRGHNSRFLVDERSIDVPLMVKMKESNNGMVSLGLSLLPVILAVELSIVLSFVK
jgi:hypothetical protein